MFIARILIAVVLIASVSYVGYFYYANKRLPTIADIPTKNITSLSISLPKKPENLETVTSNATEQIQTLGTRAGEVGQHAQNVLGTSIQVNEEEKKPLHESAIEYGRYIYCKQVVIEYEKEDGESSTKSQ